MFEKLATKLLVQHLGRYVEDLDNNNLSISMGAGTCHFRIFAPSIFIFFFITPPFFPVLFIAPPVYLSLLT